MNGTSKFVVALVASVSFASAFTVASSAFVQTNQHLATVEKVNLSAPPLAPLMGLCAGIAPKVDAAAKFLKDFTKPMAILQVSTAVRSIQV